MTSLFYALVTLEVTEGQQNRAEVKAKTSVVNWIWVEGGADQYDLFKIKRKKLKHNNFLKTVFIILWSSDGNQFTRI